MEIAQRRWVLIAREMGLASEENGAVRWSVDHLFLDQDGIPTIVEVKRSTDTRIRREVIGQMLDYADNAVMYWPVETLQARFEKTCEAQHPKQEPTEALAALLALEGTNEGDLTAFWLRVKTNLQAGRVRMIFVADVIPLELARVVEFLNTQMDPAEVLAVEVKQFANDSLRTLVPRLIGQTAEAQAKKGSVQRQWDERSFFRDLEQRQGADEASVCRELLRWAEKRNLEPTWGRGAKDGSFTLRYSLDGSTYPLVVAWTYGRVEIQFQTLATKPPFNDEAKRLELLRRLNQISGVNIASDFKTKRPSISLETLARSGSVEKLCAALEWAMEEAERAVTARSTGEQ
jgi:hypothetical protein